MTTSDASAGAAAPTRDECHWAMLSHLSAMLMYLTVIGGFIAPLVIYVLKRDEMPFVADKGARRLISQITALLALCVAGVLMWVLIGFVLVPLILLFHFVVTIIATMRASEGVAYRYPLCLRLLR